MSATRSLMTVEQAAEVLSLHPKTVLRHIREGRLAATRIGKGYRIERAALDTFAGVAPVASRRTGIARVTAIVEVDAMEADASSRLATFVAAAALSKEDGAPPLQVTTAVDATSGNVKMVIIGSGGDVARLLELIELQVQLAAASPTLGDGVGP